MMARGSSPRTAFLAERQDRYRSAETGIAARYAREAARRDELDRMRVARGLTAAELAEDNLLAGRLYMREWRRQLAQTTAQLS